MCTGRIDPATVAGAFKKGLDGLLIVGCYFGDCHYITGNVQAKAKIDMTRMLFQHIGLNEERLSFQQCSSGEASRFVELVNAFDEKIHGLGPIGEDGVGPIREDGVGPIGEDGVGPIGGDGDLLKAPEIFKKLEVAEAVLAGEKIRWLIGKRTEFLETGNKYGEIFTEHEFNRAIQMIIVEETETQEILGQFREGAQSVKDLAGALAIPSARVFRYVTGLKRKGMIELENVSGRTPIYHLVPQEA
jgi:coenzyme F420-reducing hydrogenase delta subunit